MDLFLATLGFDETPRPNLTGQAAIRSGLGISPRLPAGNPSARR
jgi:hypothetical protein